MDTEQLEKEMHIWNRLMYVALGSAATTLASSFDQFFGVIWIVLQIVVTSSGFFLLWGKRWTNLPLSKERTNTIFGYLIASWFLLFTPVILGVDSLYYIFIFGYAIFLLVTYQRTRKKRSTSEEMFP
jgi:tryptophan-rich sensory protein